ncbi:MAG: Methyltransferase domain [Rhodobacteraceae bacterium HLUCCA12]|nr:MAG: Methyltransferase domain [Rhodobacteraceae bacterium HLUCCA12]
MTSWMHAERLEAVQAQLHEMGARSVLDLGCGDGDLFLRLAGDANIARLVGLDIDAASIARLRASLERRTLHADVELRMASMTRGDPALAGFDCAVLVETIEHIAPSDLGSLERAVFDVFRPRAVIVTTPNAEFNALLGVPAHRFRHPDHRFEWTRARFQRWGQRVARTWGQRVTFHDIAGAHPDLGGASQMAVFRREGAGT